MKKYLQLAALIFKQGTLRGRGQNFNQDRAKSLENLKEFIPPKSIPDVPEPKADLSRKSSATTVRAQVAFIKSAFRNSGGHLSVDNLAYIRIPKSANTSVSYALLSKQYPVLPEKQLDETQINFLTDVHLKSVQEAETEMFFTVVRNPFARLVSVYRDFFETNYNAFIYADYLFGVLPRTLSFPEFIDRISRIPDRLKDQHIRPQHSFIAPYEEKGIAVKVFKLEDTAELKLFLAEQGMMLTHQNKSAGTYAYAEYYSPSLVEKVYKIYRKDIETMGYEEVYEALSKHLNLNI